MQSTTVSWAVRLAMAPDAIRLGDVVRLIDAMNASHYRGEMAMYARPGHIATATNLPMTSLVDETGRFRPRGDYHLFAGDGMTNFMDVTSPPLDLPQDAWDSAWGDIDNDGQLDVFLCGDAASRLFLQDAGTWRDVAATAGIAEAGACRVRCGPPPWRPAPTAGVSGALRRAAASRGLVCRTRRLDGPQARTAAARPLLAVPTRHPASRREDPE
mgnify:CR=1 FL=1